jgi:hypothetical protein
MSPDLETAIASASRATRKFHRLLEIHGISFQQLHLVDPWPDGLREVHAAWTASMVDLVQALAREAGIPDANKLSGHEQVALTVRAYELVLS